MPSPRKKRKELGVGVPTNDDSNSDSDDDEEKGEPSSPSCTVATNAAANSTKLKCLNCFRAARKDCTGKLCIRCCTDGNCLVHQEQRARARWKEAVMEGTTDIQVRAKNKRSRTIPKGRFRERAFRYMNDTVVLWDLRSVLEPTQHSQAVLPLSQAQATTNPTPSSSVSSAAFAQYQNDLKVKEEILRRSRKNNQSSLDSKTKLRRNYRTTKKRFRSVMENLYQDSLN
mmetsp:Transcript_6428/g.13277  ORF Transcript_6428/g.13277 Transcript_6428/m.13277 type:complete len:228 (+) Transcript_6428:59-742(+)